MEAIYEAVAAEKLRRGDRIVIREKYVGPRSYEVVAKEFKAKTMAFEIKADDDGKVYPYTPRRSTDVLREVPS